MSTTRDVLLDGAVHRIERKDEGDHFALRDTVDEETREQPGRLLRATRGWVTLRIDGVTRRVRLLRRGETLWVSVGGESYRLDAPRRGGAGAGGGGGDGRVEAPMPGTVLEVLVSDGEVVEEGQDLLVVEAMKMEHRLRAAFAGTVTGLTVKAGDKVDTGVAILVVEKPTEDS